MSALLRCSRPIHSQTVYGSATLGDVEEAAKEQAKGAGAHLEFFQTNWEGAFLERVHAARTDGTDGIVVNAGTLGNALIATQELTRL